MSGTLPSQDQDDGRAPRWQRLALIGGVVLVAWICLRLFAPILLPFVAAAGIAYFLDPPVAALARLGLGRSAGAAIMLLAMVAATLLFALLLYPLIVAQISLLAGQLPSSIASAQQLASHEMSVLQARLGHGVISQKLQDLVGGQAGAIVSFAGSAARRIIGGGFAIFNILTLLVITPIVAFYLLRDWPVIVARVDSWLPRSYEGVIRAQALEVNRILNAWIRGQAICCLLLALFYAVGLSVIGLNLGLIIGLTAGLLSFIPYVGTIIGAISAVVLAYGQFGTWSGAGLAFGVFGVGQMLNDYVISPRFLGGRVELPAVWVIFSLFAGGETFGFLGIMLAVPVTATIGVLIRFWLHRYLQSPLYLDAPPDHA